jgi:hypothetical protein
VSVELANTLFEAWCCFWLGYLMWVWLRPIWRERPVVVQTRTGRWRAQRNMSRRNTVESRRR